MGKALAAEFAKHYARRANRIVFSTSEGELSLNDLALELWDRLGQQGVDASVLSRVLNGVREFNSQQLSVFCDVLDLGPQQRVGLEEALARDILSRHGIRLATGIRDFLDVLYQELAQIRLSRIQGNPHTALDWANLMANKILETLPQTDGTSLRALLHVLALVYFEKAVIFSRILLRSEIPKATSPLISDMLEFAQISESKSIYGLALLAEGNLQYNSASYKGSEDHVNAALPHLKGDVISTLCGLRTLP